MKRVFFNLDTPLIDTSAEQIIQSSVCDQVLDLEDTCVLLPTRRSTRLFLNRLLVRCEEKSIRLISPPRLLTPGAFLRALLGEYQTLVGDGLSLYIWKQVLERNAEVLKPLLRKSPMPASFGEWLALARQFEELRRELYGNALTFVEVAKQLESEGLEREVERWESMRSLEVEYLNQLAMEELLDPMRQMLALLDSVVFEQTTVYCVGCVELPALLKRLLCSEDLNVTICIAGESEASESFDEFGCLHPAAQIPQVAFETLVVDAFEDQGSAVASLLSRVSKDYSQDDILISCCDERSWDVLRHQLKEYGLKARPAAGKPLQETSLFRLLNVVGNYLATPTFTHLSSLIRHPAVESFLQRSLSEELDRAQSNIPAVLDAYYQAHLPATVADPPRVTAKIDVLFGEILGILHSALAVLRVKKLPLSEWSAELTAFLDLIFPGMLGSQNMELKESSFELSDMLAQFGQGAGTRTEKVSGAEFLSLLNRLASSKRLPLLPDPESVDLYGWLETQLDPARVVIVTDAVEGRLPAALNADLFLPDSLRQRLGLPCNEQRFARDAFLLQSIQKSSEQMFMVLSKLGSTGDFVTPSRFLCAGAGVETAKRLVVGAPCTFEREQLLDCNSVEARSLPPPDYNTAVDSVSVTSLKTYLTCPYLFYLQHVLRLEQIHDRARELDALQFGNLIHGVLEDFAKTDVAKSLDDSLVFHCLSDLLDTRAGRLFGREVEPAVLVQIEQARQRMRYVAAAHAKRVADGWELLESEWSFGERVILEIGEQIVSLRGRVDRIEKHESSGAIAVLDYKSGESILHPDKAHRKKISGTKPPEYEWIDLQLPAYCFALRAHGYSEKLIPGYFDIGSKPEQIGIHETDWSEEVVSNGVEAIRAVVSNIVANEFWPPKRLPHPASPLRRLYHGLTVEQIAL